MSKRARKAAYVEAAARAREAKQAIAAEGGGGGGGGGGTTSPQRRIMSPGSQHRGRAGQRAVSPGSTWSRSFSAPHTLHHVPSTRSISVATYSAGHDAPHATPVVVGVPDPAHLPPAPLKVKLRSADPRMMRASESREQLVHMQYIGLTPEYSRRIKRRGKSLPAFKRAGYGQVRACVCARVRVWPLGEVCGCGVAVSVGGVWVRCSHDGVDLM